MGTLYVVATPIGNLEDITLRALRILGEVHWLLAEDTRHTAILLKRHEIRARMRSLHAHNESARTADVLAALADGEDVALVSDAGTPLVSDPGARLVAAVAAVGGRVEAIPGPSATLAALSVAGLPSHPFAFLGFLPRKAGARRKCLAAYVARPETLVLFESPRRLAATLRDLLEALGDRPACVARELTKLHEEVVRAPLSELAERFAQGTRGEVTLVVAGADEGAARRDDGIDLESRLDELIAAGASSREIAATLAAQTGLPRREIYARAVAARAKARRTREDE